MINKAIKHLKNRTLLIVVRNKWNYWINKLYSQPVYYYFRDLKNIIRYGVHAPKYAERIWINPLDCHYAISKEAKHLHYFWTRKESGLIINQWPGKNEKQIIPIMERESVKSSYDHWLNGLPWEETDEYRFIESALKVPGAVTGFSNLNEAMERFKRLDHIYDQVRKDENIKTRVELYSSNFREKGGIYIHIGPDGEIILGDGFHRFVMARINNISKIPAQLGCVYKGSLHYLPQYRRF